MRMSKPINRWMSVIYIHIGGLGCSRSIMESIVNLWTLKILKCFVFTKISAIWQNFNSLSF